jgi:hypothetical protein
MKIGEIANTLGISPIDVVSFDQSLMDNAALRMAVQFGQTDTVENFQISDREARFIIEAYQTIA